MKASIHASIEQETCIVATSISVVLLVTFKYSSEKYVSFNQVGMKLPPDSHIYNKVSENQLGFTKMSILENARGVEGEDEGA